jgi:solute:Na+ symporter, SSS family
MNDLVFAGADGIFILAFYAIVMLVIGYYSGKGEKNLHDSLSNYYLAGKNLGFIALFFTLYATQYSGNTIVGYAPTAYRLGFSWLQSISFMTIIIAIYLLFAPRLYVISKRHNFVTPTDWLQFRFKSKAVTILGILLMLWGLGNYLLEQLVAIGHAVAGVTGGTIPYQIGVIVFVLVMLIYEWMGGMKAVAFTDVMQGLALMLGVFVFLFGALTLVGGDLSEVTKFIAQHEPEKIAVPPLETSINWFSMLLLVGFGAAIYPHAIQRIYSAESERTLKRSFARMAWMPPVTTGLVFIVGIIGIMVFPGLDESGSEQLVGAMANKIAAINSFYYWVMVLFFGGIVAAIISTADSVLLSLSSMISNDVYGKFINPNAPERKKVMVGKISGVLIVMLLLWIAWYPPATLYEIFVLKFELLVQVFPAFILGLYWKRLSATPVFVGMIAGALFAGVLTITGHKTLFGIHGGVLGLMFNLLICVVGSFLVPVSSQYKREAEELTALKIEV